MTVTDRPQALSTSDWPRPSSAPAHRLPSFSAFWETLEVGLDLTSGLVQRMTEHDVTRARIGGRRFVGLRHPDHVDQIFHAKRLNFTKSLEFEPIKAAAGINLLTDEGDSWATHRAALNPLFARRRLNDMIGLMEAPIAAMIDDLDANSGRIELDMHDEMVQMTLRVVANSLFSQDLGEVINTMNAWLTEGMEVAELILRLTLVGALPRPIWPTVTRMVYSPIPMPPPFRGMQRIAQSLDKSIDRILAERYANPIDSPDLLKALIEADGGTWGRQRVRDEALTFMLAGHETTANAMSWFWYLMALNPAARDRMLQEIDTVLQGRRPTADDLENLPWTAACIQESQRYFSAVPVLPRVALADDIVGGHRIRRGTTVLVPVHHIHHDPRFWENPDEFDPNRFMPGAPKRHRSAFMPFGGGRRICIGQSFAMLEMIAVASMMSQRFTFDLVPGHPVVPAQSLTLRPKHGLMMTARRRQPTHSGAAVPGMSASEVATCPHADAMLAGAR